MRVGGLAGGVGELGWGATRDGERFVEVDVHDVGEGGGGEGGWVVEVFKRAAAHAEVVESVHAKDAVEVGVGLGRDDCGGYWLCQPFGVHIGE